MKILYVGSLDPNETIGHRIPALRALGHEVVTLDASRALPPAGRLVTWLRDRLLIGPSIDAFNRRVLEAAQAARPAIALFDRVIYLQPATVRALEADGIRTVHWMPDNPFGPRGDPWWRLFLRCIPHHSGIILVNPASAPEYRARGVRAVVAVPQGYVPELQYPPPAGWSDADRPRDVVFVGSPYDDRGRFLVELYRRHGVATQVFGKRWERTALYWRARELWAGGPLFRDAYREAFWRSKICLGFVTRANCDTFAHRWFEIAASGAFLLAERTADGLATFEEDREAVFFTGVEECAAKIRRYLPDREARERIAAAGRARCERSGYDIGGRVRQIMDQLIPALGLGGALPKAPDPG